MSIIKEGRAVGNTTRAIDEAVQDLFNKGVTLIIDPYEGGTHEAANRHMMEGFKRRMEREHPNVPIHVTKDKTGYIVRLR